MKRELGGGLFCSLFQGYNSLKSKEQGVMDNPLEKSSRAFFAALSGLQRCQEYKGQERRKITIVAPLRANEPPLRDNENPAVMIRRSEGTMPRDRCIKKSSTSPLT